MILRRYMTNQIAMTTTIVLGFLVFLLLGGRLIRYFGMAAEGNLDITLLFKIIGYNLPYFLELILPLAFFIALMLVFGRLYVDNEMAVINSSGVSRGKLARLITPLILLLFFCEAGLSVVGKPWGVRQSENIWEQQALQSVFDLIKPGEFISNGDYHLYVGSLNKGDSQNQPQLQDVIIIQTAASHDKNVDADTSADIEINNANNESNSITEVALPKDVNKPLPIALNSKDTLILAKSAKQVTTDSSSGKTQLDLFNGRRYEVSANSRNYNKVSFGQYRITLTEKLDNEVIAEDVEIQTIQSLLQSVHNSKNQQAQIEAQAELAYRLALPWLIILAPMFAITLAQVRPRQGRWLKLVPSILLFVCIALSFISLKKPISEGKVTVYSYPLLIVILIGLALYLNWASRIHQRIRSKIHSKQINPTQSLINSDNEEHKK